ncbi:MAG: hypothetical protein ACJ8FZ_10855 [Bradyrhizobium sp.]
MIKIKIPAIKATIAGTCAAVMTIEITPADLVENRIEGGSLPAGVVPK